MRQRQEHRSSITNGRLAMAPSFELAIDASAASKLSSSEGWQWASQRRAKIAGSAGSLGDGEDTRLPCELHIADDLPAVTIDETWREEENEGQERVALLAVSWTLKSCSTKSCGVRGGSYTTQFRSSCSFAQKRPLRNLSASLRRSHFPLLC